MELPFAVEASSDLSSIPLTPSNVTAESNNEDDAGSLVTASSQGSLVQSQSTEYDQMLSTNQHSNTPSNLSPQTPSPKQPSHHPRLVENRGSGLKPSSYSIASSSSRTAATAPPPHHHEQATTVDPKPSTFSSSLVATGSRVASVLSHLTTTAATSLSGTADQQQERTLDQQKQQRPLETVDFFTYVNVWETDADEVDILLPSSTNNPLETRANQETGDILTLLMNRVGSNDNIGESQDEDVARLVDLLEQANQTAHMASLAKQEGNLQQALDYHTRTAKIFHQAALLAKPSHGALSCCE